MKFNVETCCIRGIPLIFINPNLISNVGVYPNHYENWIKLKQQDI
jgi:hypothetical protein